VLEAFTGEKVVTFGRGAWVGDWAMAPDGSHLVYLERLVPGQGGDEHELVLSRIELPSGATRVLERTSVSDVGDRGYRLLFGESPGEVALVTGYNTWRWIDTATGKTRRTSAVRARYRYSEPFEAGPVLHPGRRLALIHGVSPDGSRAGDFVVWDFEAEKEKWRLPRTKDAYTQAAFSPDGRWLAAADRTGRVLVFDVEDGTVAAEYEARSLWFGITSDPPIVTGIKFDPSGRRVALQMCRVWEVLTPPCQVTVCDFTPGSSGGPK
jgi:hypothetical protein